MSGGSQEPFLFVTGGVTGEYAALSHCWGGSLKKGFTTSNIDTFSRRIQLSSLPPTFRGAVSMARSLGLQFLWIDAMCIIQDARADWAIESEDMDRI
jgi:hypothetical protein